MASVKDVIGSALLSHQVDLENVKQTKTGSRLILNITIDGDGEQGRGLNLDEVAEVSRIISQALDDSNVLGEASYVLQVGTRGVDCPLTKPTHFRRNTGRLVKVKTNQWEEILRIAQVNDDGVEFSTGTMVSFSEIIRAVVQVEMNHDEDVD